MKGNILRFGKVNMVELSRMTGIGYYTLQKYNCGARGITVANAKKIGKALGFDWWLLFETEEQENQEVALCQE